MMIFKLKMFNNFNCALRNPKKMLHQKTFTFEKEQL